VFGEIHNYSQNDKILTGVMTPALILLQVCMECILSWELAEATEHVGVLIYYGITKVSWCVSRMRCICCDRVDAITVQDLDKLHPY